ncbi:MAG: LicD family protein [Pseudoruegeria sp.]
MINSVPQEMNLNNLREVYKRIAHLDAFVFFGTLLGYTREGNIIAHDDDIDVYINKSSRDEVLAAFDDGVFEPKVSPKARSGEAPLIVQFSRFQDGVKTFADFYFFDDTHEEYIKEDWNFKGTWRKPETHLHVPKSLIYPLKSVDMQGIEIKVPAEPDAVCEYLYGPTWKTPVKKGSEYKMAMVENKPKFRLMNKKKRDRA